MVDQTIDMGFINQRSHHWGAPSCNYETYCEYIMEHILWTYINHEMGIIGNDVPIIGDV